MQQFEDVPAADRWLSARELAVLDKLNIPKRQHDWRLGRWTAKRVVANCFGLGDDLAQVEIVADEDGAPEVLLNGAAAGISVSISHSNGFGFCVASRAAAGLGCDIERIESRSDEFITDYFTDEEAARCRESPEHLALLSTLIWSAKESVLKVLRAGLRLDTRSITIKLDTGESGSGWHRFTARSIRDARCFEGMWRVQQGFVLTIGWEQPHLGSVELLTSANQSLTG